MAITLHTQGDTFDNSHPLLIVDYADAACSGGTSVPACGPAGLNPDTLSITLDSVSATDSSVNSGPDRAVSRRRAELRKEAIREK